MKTYDSYKDSGIEWIGEIPSHWEVKKLKRLAKIGNGQDHKKVWDENGEYPIIGTGGAFGKANMYLHKGPSVILGRKGTIDKPQFVESPFWSVDTAYYTEINQDVDPKLFYYLCTTINFELYKYGSAVPSMTQEVLSQIPFAVPDSLEDQSTIASYLDKKTAEIDELIADKKRLLELYEEEKTAVINQAVTKGLDPNSPMKNSGIEWLGEIPEHWEVKRLKYVAKMQGGFAFSSNDFISDGIQLIKISNLYNNELHLDRQPTFLADTFLESHSDWIVSNGDILMSMTGTLGKRDYGFAILIQGIESHLLLNQRVSKIHSVDEIEVALLIHGLRCEYFLNSIFCLPAGTKQGNFSNENILCQKIAFPSDIIEQQSIVHYIKMESKRIDAKKAKTQKLIDLLTEYRTALISEVVTGKVKVIN